MRSWTRTVVVTSVLALFASAPVAAQKNKFSISATSSSGTQMAIENVGIDLENEVLSINGDGFGTAAPIVRLGGVPLTVLSTTSTQLVVYLPAATAPGAYLLTVEKPTNGDKAAGFVVTIGTTGPAGPQGPAGPAGDVGPQGPLGPQGEVGPAGPQGPVGPQGEVGAQGPAGPTGPQGPAGPQGEVGPQGAVGPVGPQGPQGPQGEVGATGPMGPMGVAGPEGPAGPSGPAGPAGPAGPTGPQGPQGPAGVSGWEVRDEADPPFTLSPGASSMAQEVSCSSGKVPLGGGYDLVNTAIHTVVTSSAPTLTGWRVQLRNNTGYVLNNVQVRVWAVCGSAN